MSRSYSKFPSRRDSEYFKRKDIRVHNRASIHQELVNPDYGDALFVSNKKLLSDWLYYREYKTKKGIRKDFNLEIRKILNGCSDRYMSWGESFIESFNYIRGGLFGEVRIYPFEWLISRKVRKVIKEWQGNPFDVLKFLTDHGYVEKAIRLKFKKNMSK